MKYILLFVIGNSIIYLVNSFAMNVSKINSKYEYNKIICNYNRKKVILYNSIPCKACIKMKDNFEILSKKISDWDFYEVDLRIIYNICKKKKINRLPVLEFYKYNDKPYIIRCTPFIENNILQNFI